MATSTYTTTVAPIAEAQIDAALLWWSRNRAGARDLLAREIDAAIGAIEQVPQMGRRTRSRLFRDVRRRNAAKWVLHRNATGCAMHEAMATEATRLDRRLRARDLDTLPHEWDTRYELVGGVLFMSTRPSMVHQRTIARLIVALHAPVTAVGGIVVPEPGLVWEEDGDDSVAPDVAVVLADRLTIVDTKLRGAPNLIIEVLSPGPEARRRDHEAKRELYFRRGVLEYWMIEPEARAMLRLTRGSDDWIEEQLDEAAVVRTPLLSHWDGTTVMNLLPPRPNES